MNKLYKEKKVFFGWLSKDQWSPVGLESFLDVIQTCSFKLEISWGFMWEGSVWCIKSEGFYWTMSMNIICLIYHINNSIIVNIASYYRHLSANRNMKNNKINSSFVIIRCDTCFFQYGSDPDMIKWIFFRFESLLGLIYFRLFDFLCRL